MSGFIAIYNIDGKPVQPRLLSSLTQSLKFRGPDKQHIWVDEQIGMGHALFKTTFEAEYENQPATIDNKVWITCSARIDDRKNLVNKMGMKKEINLSLTPDSELILHAYRKWGEECLVHLLGDFAFVIWDNREKKLFCARDRFGMRQLYYAQKNKSFIVCNSLGSILKHPDINNELNERAIGGFLLFGNYTWMDKSITMFNDIMTLLPAHKLVIKNGHIDIRKYWDIPDNIPLLHYKNDQDYVEHFLEVFTHAVSDRIRTSSIAISMSGGMDSTSVAAITKQLQNLPNTQINAVSIVYNHLMPCRERYYSGLVADRLDIPIHYIVGDEYPFLYPSVETTHPMELTQPTLWMDIEKKLSQFSRVVLTGASADNLFQYPSSLLPWKESSIVNVMTNKFKLQKLYHKRPPLGIGLRTKLKKWMLFNTKKVSVNYTYPTWIHHDFEKRMELRAAWQEMWSSLQKKQSIHTRQAAMQWSLIRPDWSNDDILMENDFTLSEKRDPFLDLRMVELILSFPALPWLFNKHILRAAMRGLLPDEVRYRPKTPLGYLEHALIQKEENNWIKSWKPNAISSTYINETFSTQGFDDQTNNYLNARPIVLDAWLKENV